MIHNHDQFTGCGFHNRSRYEITYETVVFDALNVYHIVFDTMLIIKMLKGVNGFSHCRIQEHQQQKSEPIFRIN